ncbi:hypothetical protein DY000_02002351 [Brassica cretica]|uniref:Uncharacterized protein n=1 Tax=Brassica cretica TaxID=69181 RepID=A0ABQ7CJR9_BRACR|nr:hypothetical protein DY000_02002351 [Brassica cretica]
MSPLFPVAMRLKRRFGDEWKMKSSICESVAISLRELTKLLRSVWDRWRIKSRRWDRNQRSDWEHWRVRCPR